MFTPKDRFEELLPGLSARVRELMNRAGLDPDDPKVIEVLSDPCDFETFNERLDALIEGKRKARSKA